MKQSYGFFVLEFMIYLLLFSLLAVFLLYFMLRTTLFLKERSAEFNKEIFLYRTLDIMSNSIQKAPAHKHAYKCLRPDTLIWQDPHTNMDVGFIKNNKGLWYVKGNFNPVDQRWDRKRSSLIIKGLKEVVFDYSYCQGAYDYLDAITVYLITFDKKVKTVVHCNSRILL